MSEYSEIRKLILEVVHGKEDVAGKPTKPTRYIFHVSDKKNRRNIYKQGLVPSVGDSYEQWVGAKKEILAKEERNAFPGLGNLADGDGALSRIG